MAVKVKICGITTVDDAVAAAKFGADYIGLNFYPGSPRCISPGKARLILQALPKSVTPVGLFVNERWRRIIDVATSLSIPMVQIHGDKLTPCPVGNLLWVPAFPVKARPSLDRIRLFALRSLCRKPIGNRQPTAVLVDGSDPGKFGGTGKTAPWHLLADNGELRILNLILAGGLTPDNVAEAIGIVRPWAVDVASGVESSPGVKDHDKMRRFIDNARAAE